MLLFIKVVKKRSARQYFRDGAFLKKIGTNLRAVKLSKDMTQESLANECELDYSQINGMELGKVNFNISHLYKIAAVLRIDPKTLLP